MGKTFEKYIPSTPNELKTQLEAYDIEDVKEQQNKIKETTWKNLKEAHRETMISLISGYILNKKIEIEKINIIWSEISFNWHTLPNTGLIETGLSWLTEQEISMWIQMDFIKRYFPKQNSWKKISEKIALDYKNDFKEKVIEKKDEFNNDIESFRKYLITKDPTNKQIYKIIRQEELKLMWASTQIELATKLKVIWIEEITGPMDKLLGWMDIPWTNWKTLTENWKEANWLLKAWATIAWLYWLYKVITSMWDSNKNPFKWHFWWAIGVWLIWELIGQVYTWKSFIQKWIWEAAGFLWGESNLNKLRTQHEKLNNNESSEIKDYTWLFLLALWNKKKKDVLWNFDFINESSKDPMVQMLIMEAKQRWENISNIKKNLEKWKNSFVKNSLESLNLWIKMNIQEIMNISWGWDTFSDKITVLLERRKKLEEKNIIKKITDKWVNSSSDIIISTLKVDYISKEYIKTWNPIIEIDLSPVWKNEIINITL